VGREFKDSRKEESPRSVGVKSKLLCLVIGDKSRGEGSRDKRKRRRFYPGNSVVPESLSSSPSSAHSLFVQRKFSLRRFRENSERFELEWDVRKGRGILRVDGDDREGFRLFRERKFF
jgi:hypothetical protein